MHLTHYKKEKWALIGLLHPYISTPSTVTHIFNHLTPTPELSPTPSTVTPSTITPSPSHPQPSHPQPSQTHHHNLTHPYTLYLMVESDDTVTMTRSSYCRHSTESVWPTSSVVTLRDLWSQICSEWRVSCHNIIPYDYNLQVNFVMPLQCDVT